MYRKYFLLTSSSFSWRRLLCHSLVQFFRWAAKPTAVILSTVVLCIIFFSSCEKVIDVNLTEASTKYVIEGNVYNDGSPAEVTISQTKDFEDDNSFNGVSGATVTIKVNDGSIYTLSETSTGIYQAIAFVGEPGSTYTLSVTISNTTYTSTSVMPSQLVSLDTLTVEDLAFGGSDTKTIHPLYRDPIGLGNSYRFIEFDNGEQVKKVFVQDDELSDGLIITRPLLNTDGDIASGDTVLVKMFCIDKNVYKYWYSLDQASTGENQSATPANPVSNINGDALGYFSAQSVSSYTIVVP